jgi:hypothetical protein
MHKALAATLPVLALGLLGASCDIKTTCGQGTVDKNGTCVGTPGAQLKCGPGTSPQSGNCVANCGPDTTLVGNYCIPNSSLCGPNTKVVTTDDAGDFQCVGTGQVIVDAAAGDAGGNCGDAGSDDSGHCKPPCVPTVCTSADYTSTTTCIAGRVFNVNGGAVIDGVAEGRHAYFFPPLTFVGNPTGTCPTADSTIDSCGYYKIKMAKPNLGFGAVAIAGNPLSTGTCTTVNPDLSATKWIFTGVAFVATANVPINGQQTFVVSAADDAAWSTMAGLTGTTFAQNGATLVQFQKPPSFDAGAFAPTTPVGHVIPTIGGANADPTMTPTFYFTDTAPTLNTLVAGTSSNMTVDGNGWALMTSGSMSIRATYTLSGTCADATCSGEIAPKTGFTSNLAAAPAGLYFVTNRSPM